MSALFVAGWAEADGPDGAALHVIAVVFVCLGVGAEFQANVPAIIHVFAGKKVAG